MRLSLFWRVFAVNAGLLGGIALLLLVSPVEIDAPIKARQALIVVGALVITLAANALLLRGAITPLERICCDPGNVFRSAEATRSAGS
jgi:two-component system sensor histidine kinase UhpB